MHLQICCAVMSHKKLQRLGPPPPRGCGSNRVHCGISGHARRAATAATAAPAPAGNCRAATARRAATAPAGNCRAATGKVDAHLRPESSQSTARSPGVTLGLCGVRPCLRGKPLRGVAAESLPLRGLPRALRRPWGASGTVRIGFLLLGAAACAACGQLILLLALLLLLDQDRFFL